MLWCTLLLLINIWVKGGFDSFSMKGSNKKLYTEPIIGLIGNLVDLGIWQYNVERDHLEWDEVMFRIFDVDPHKFKHQFSDWRQTVHPEDVEGAESSFKESVRTNGEFVYTFRIIDASGNIRWIKANALMSQINEKGERIITGANQNITEFIKIKEEQDSLTETLKDSQRTARIGSWEFFPNTNKSVMDEVTKSIYGYPPERDIPAEEGIKYYKEGWSRDTILKAFADLLDKQKAYDLELPMINAQGEEIWVRTIGKAKTNENGEVVKTSGVFQDITDQKRKEQQLLESQRRFKGAFEYSAIGMALVGLNGQWLRVNNQIVDYLSYTKSELLKMTFQDITHPDDLAKDLNFLEECVEGRRDNYRMDKRYIRKDGSLVWALLSVAIVRDQDNKPLYFISQLEDITERKKYEKDLESANEKLRRLTDKLIDQNRSLNDFAHITSHNLRAPVANLLQLNELYDSAQEENYRNELFSMIKESTHELKKTLDQLMEALVIKNKGGLGMEEVKLTGLVKTVLKKLGALIDSTESRVILDLQLESLLVNPYYLESILMNLISNSIKYKHPDRKAEIKIKAWTDQQANYLSVQDNGLGIDLQRHGRKIFGLNKTFHKNSDANGVGLFMVKSQVDAMSAKVSVDSTPGEGTNFTIKLKPN